MATVANVVEDWCSGDSDRTAILATELGVIVRWVNEAQLRFADKTETVRSIWQPSIPSNGQIALPTDFIREVKNLIMWTTNWRLLQIDYPLAQMLLFSAPQYYSIWNGTFYVWSPTAGTPNICYIQKPTAITTTTYATASLQIPTEYQHTLFLYFDSMNARRQKDYAGSGVLLKQFDQECNEIYSQYKGHVDPVPMVNGSFF